MMLNKELTFHFLERLNEEKTKRVRVDRQLALFRQVFPDSSHLSTLEEKERLMAVLCHLEENDCLTFSVGREPNGLPKFVVLEKLEPAKPDSAQYDWQPIMAKFAPELRDKRQIRIAKEVDAFFRDRPEELEHYIRVKERSLQVFSDEKRLEELLNKEDETLLGGRITLVDLKCYRPELLMRREEPLRAYPGKPFLVVENVDTFGSLAQWNERKTVYIAVAFGEGNKFYRACRTLGKEAEELAFSRVEYFGDIDLDGFLIPMGANQTLAKLGLPQVYPAVRWYRWLMEHGKRVDGGRQLSNEFEERLMAWLRGEEELAKRIIGLLRDGKRIAQEALNGRELMKLKF